ASWMPSEKRSFRHKSMKPSWCLWKIKSAPWPNWLRSWWMPAWTSIIATGPLKGPRPLRSSEPAITERRSKSFRDKKNLFFLQSPHPFFFLLHGIGLHHVRSLLREDPVSKGRLAGLLDPKGCPLLGGIQLQKASTESLYPQRKELAGPDLRPWRRM